MKMNEQRQLELEPGDRVIVEISYRDNSLRFTTPVQREPLDPIKVMRAIAKGFLVLKYHEDKQIIETSEKRHGAIMEGVPTKIAEYSTSVTYWYEAIVPTVLGKIFPDAETDKQEIFLPSCVR